MKQSKIDSLLSHTFRTTMVVAALLGGCLQLPTSASAQTTVPTWAQSYGFGVYDGSGQPTNDNTYGSGADLPSGIAAMPDGGVVVAGQLSPFEIQSPSSTSYHDAGLVRYNATGAIVWQQLLRLPGNNPDDHTDVNEVLTDSTGNIFICGQQTLHTGGGGPFVAKFGADGGLVWQNGLIHVVEDDGQFGNEPYGVTQYTTMDLTSDGGVIVGSGVYSQGNGHIDPIIVKFNSDGSLGFHRIFASQNQYSSVHSICARPGGNGYALLLATYSPGYGIVVVLTDAAGNPVAQRTFNADGTGGDGQFITRSADGGFLFLSLSGTEVHKIGADLSPIWSQRLLNFTGANVLTPTADGGCIVGGTLSEAAFKSGGNNTPNALLLTLDSAGVLKSAHLLGGPGGDGGGEGPSGSPSIQGAPLVSCLTTDGAVAFAISSLSYATGSSYKADWWIVKSDSNGKVVGFGDTMTDAPLNFFGESSTGEQASFISSDYGATLTNEVSATAEAGQPFVQEDLGNNTGINKPTIKNQTIVPIPPPLHGGLSGMTFTVNESTEASVLPTNKVLRFRAVQSGHPAGLNIRVQSSVDGGIHWTDLPGGTHGTMTYDVAENAYVLNSTNYPSVSNVYFRAFALGSGYPSPASAPVYPFDLSGTPPHLPPVNLLVKRNGTSADAKFTAGQSAPPSGVSLRIQSSFHPAREESWTDLADGNSGTMTRSTNPTYPDLFLLLANNNLPASTASDPVYFRAISRLSGSLDSISNFTGPHVVTPVTPPSVTVQVPGGDAGSGDGRTPNAPIVLSAANTEFRVAATTDRNLLSLSLQISGKTVYTVSDGSKTIDYVIANLAPADYVVEGLAVDDMHTTSRAGTGAVYIRVVSSAPSSARTSRVGSSGYTKAASTTGNTFTAVVSSSIGLWNDPNTWTDTQGKPGVPGPNDFAIVANNAEVILSEAVVVKSLTLQGQLQNYAGTADVDLTVTGHFAINYGQFFGLHVIIAPGATCEALTGINSYSGSIENNGTFALHGPAGMGGLREFIDHGKVIFQLPISIPTDAASNPASNIRALPITVSGGTIVGSNPDSLLSENGAALDSTLVNGSGGYVISSDSASVVSNDGGSLITQDGGGLITQDGGGLITQDGGGLVAQGGGNLIGNAGGAFHGESATVHRETTAAADSTDSGFTQTGGETDLSAVTIIGPMTLNGGVLSGSGVILGDLTNNSGYIAPGHSAGLLAVTGSFTQGPNGTLVVENGGASPNQFDQLSVGGTASLGGKLDVKLINGYVPDPADTFSPLAYSSVSGSFASVSSNAQVTTNDSGLLLTTNPGLPNAQSGQPLNISTRLAVLGGDNILIGGFIVYDPSGAGGSKKVLIRALGPSLPVGGTLADPYLELHNPDGSVVANDNWQDSSSAGDIPDGFAPSDARESALVVTLAPGAYTAQVKGAHGETGIGLVEVYDLDSTSTAKLANISTRGFVDTGDNVLIGGFIVGGQDPASPFNGEPAKILVRAIGPSLADAGVQGALTATSLELHDQNGSVISNEGWRSDQEAAIIATTIPPTNDNDSAILATLVPGPYTAIVRGKDGSTGIGLVEAYNLQ